MEFVDSILDLLLLATIIIQQKIPKKLIKKFQKTKKILCQKLMQEKSKSYTKTKVQKK